MDKFTRVIKIPDFNSIPGRSELARNIWNAIQTRCCLCIYGKSGCGKTFIIKKILGEDYYDSEKISDTFSHAVIENPSNEIIEKIKLHGSLTNGSTIIVCEDIKKIDFCNCIEIPTFTYEQLVELFPGYEEEAKMCQGNMWNFEFYKQFRDKKDIFMTPKEYVKHIMSTPLESYIKNSVEEHGHTWGMIHENYVDTRGLTVDEMDKIADCMSLADIYDQKIYETEWDYCKYFQIMGIATPSQIIHGRHNKVIRPGSSWTKLNNQKMRENKLKKFRDFDHYKYILILKFLMTHADPCEFANMYDITPQDVDVINHLMLSGKFKPSEVSRLKKKLIACRATS